jgi:hypothetical protein
MRAIDADALSYNFDGMMAVSPTGYIHGDTIADMIGDAPTIEPQRKKGKWINIRHDNIAECDQCGITGRAWMNFCFDCGADMRRRDDEH